LGDLKNTYKVLGAKHKGRRAVLRLSLGWRIILKMGLRERSKGVDLLNQLRIGFSGWLFKDSSESLGSIKMGNFLLADCHLLKEDSALCV
jgi:hypothetical protein